MSYELIKPIVDVGKTIFDILFKKDQTLTKSDLEEILIKHNIQSQKTVNCFIMFVNRNEFLINENDCWFSVKGFGGDRMLEQDFLKQISEIFFSGTKDIEWLDADKGQGDDFVEMLPKDSMIEMINKIKKKHKRLYEQ